MSDSFEKCVILGLNERYLHRYYIYDHTLKIKSLLNLKHFKNLYDARENILVYKYWNLVISATLDYQSCADLEIFSTYLNRRIKGTCVLNLNLMNCNQEQKAKGDLVLFVTEDNVK